MAGRERSCFGGLKLSIIEHGVPSILDKLDGTPLYYNKAEPHSKSEVIKYITDQYGFIELERSLDEYQIQYKGMRASFIMEYVPELLGEYAELPQLMSQDEEGIRNYIVQQELRQKAAESVPEELFDIDLHIFKKKLGDGEMDFLIETK